MRNPCGARAKSLGLFAALSTPLLLHTSARANLTIDPTFNSSITSDPNAGLIESGINAAVTQLESYVANSVTVDVTFGETTDPTDLGDNLTATTAVPLAQYKTALQTQQVLSADDNSAIANLPASSFAEPLITTPLARALGIAGPPTGSDATVNLNTSMMNLSRSGAQNPADYDLQATTLHELDEVLGIGGNGSVLGTTNNNGFFIGPLDFFRYVSPGMRSFADNSNSTNPEGIAPYFSIDGGNTAFVHFNQYAGGDFGDWGDGHVNAEPDGNKPPQVQDAFGTPGVDVNIGPNELAALDVVGWNLTAPGSALEAQVPEPASLGIAAIAVSGLLIRRRRV